MTAPFIALLVDRTTAARFADAVSDRGSTLSHAETAVSLLGELLSTGDLKEHHGIEGMAYLCSLGLKACDLQDDPALEHLQGLLIDAGRPTDGRQGGAA